MIANPLEDNMTNFQSLLTLTAIVASTTLLALSTFSTSAEASMTSRLNSCRFDSKARTLDCCEEITRNKKPLWMREGNLSCQQAVVCTPKKKKTAITYVAAPDYGCYVKIPVNNRQGSSNGQPDTQGGGNYVGTPVGVLPN
jgi:hypothetical protein